MFVYVSTVQLLQGDYPFSLLESNTFEESRQTIPSADCVQLHSGLPHFEAGVGVNVVYPVNCFQCQRP